MTEWQPIETAPRDSRFVLIYVPKRDASRRMVMEAWWRIPFDGAPDKAGGWQTMGGVCLSADVHGGLGATHWMPLPEPPLPSPLEA